MPPNLKQDLGASTEIRNLRFPFHSRIPHLPADLCDLLCEEKAIMQITKFLLLTWQADFTLWFELPLHRFCLPRWADSTVEKLDHAVKSLAAWVLGIWVSPTLAASLADGTDLNHATHGQHDRQWQSLPNSPIFCSAHPNPYQVSKKMLWLKEKKYIPLKKRDLDWKCTWCQAEVLYVYLRDLERRLYALRFFL